MTSARRLPESASALPRVLYIAGAGHSGSTILDILLGNHEHLVSLGEISFLPEEWCAGTLRCSCGMPGTACAFWGPLVRDTPPTGAEARAVRAAERPSALPRILLGLAPADMRGQYRDVQQRLLRYAAARRGARIAVDSSKTTKHTVGRAVALERVAGAEVYVLHLVRNGLATIVSHLRIAERRPRGPRAQVVLRAATGWLAANLWASALSRLVRPRRYLRVRYEDLIGRPADVLHAIGQWCGFDPSDLVAMLDRDEALTVGHLTRGNRVRLQGTVRLRREPDAAPGRSLRPVERALFALVAGPLHRAYGYGWAS